MTLFDIGLGTPLGEIRFTAGNLFLDVYEHRVSLGNTPIQLAPDEYRCLMYLLRKRGAVVSRDELHRHLYKNALKSPDLKIIDVYISKIRRKLAIIDPNSNYIQTIRYKGYSIESNE